ncbi:MAG: histidine kinase N-terminal 7TM domain-containing protein [Anaerolineales bacterium]
MSGISPIPVVFLALTIVLTLVLAVIGWRRSQFAGAKYFSLMLLAAGWWSACELGELLSESLAGSLRWSQLAYLGIALLPVMWFFFALAYTGRLENVNRAARLFFFVIPVITILLVWSYPRSQLVWMDVFPLPGSAGGFVYLHGAWFWLHTVYAYFLLMVGTLVLLLSILRAPPMYRRQIWVVAIGAALPWAANIAYLAGVSPLSGIDPTPIAFGVTGLLFTLGLWQFGFLHLMPVARDLLVESMGDGMLVIDRRGIVLDTNPAARQLLGLADEHHVGEALKDFAPFLAQGLAETAPDAPATFELLPPHNPDNILEVRLMPLRVSRKPGGWLINLRDITTVKNAELTLETNEANFRTIVESAGVPMILTLQADGRILYANQQAQEYLGITQNRLQDRLAIDYYQDPTQRSQLLAVLDAQGQVDDFELGLQSEDGRSSWLLVAARRIYYQGGAAILTTFQDITEQRQRMDLLERARAEAESAREMAEINARQLQNALGALEKQATTDELTGALNRRRFIELMHRELSMVRRYQRPAGLLMFDLDGFKQVNDTLGHQVGDEVLKEISATLDRNLRRTDYLVRWGGDEFIVLAPELSLEQACLLGEKLRELIGAEQFSRVGRMSASLGVAELTTGDTIDSVVRRVDRALYRAKARGGNCVEADEISQADIQKG